MFRRITIDLQAKIHIIIEPGRQSLHPAGGTARLAPRCGPRGKFRDGLAGFVRKRLGLLPFGSIFTARLSAKPVR